MNYIVIHRKCTCSILPCMVRHSISISSFRIAFLTNLFDLLGIPELPHHSGTIPEMTCHAWCDSIMHALERGRIGIIRRGTYYATPTLDGQSVYLGNGTFEALSKTDYSFLKYFCRFIFDAEDVYFDRFEV